MEYDKLVIATGGAPALDVPGPQLGNVFTCSDLAGTIHLRAFVEQERPKRAVIIGSGYIGLEVADALVRRGMEVAILERSGSVLEGIEPEIGERVEKALHRHGVRLIKDAAATTISGNAQGGATTVQYGAGGSESAEPVLLATGIVPRVELAATAGVRIGRTGAIAADERMLTSVNSIYASGDCVEVRHLVTWQPAYLPLGTTANKQGRVAGENAGGGHARFDGVVSKPILVKLVWDRTTGRMLGCQMAGEQGIAKRIDVAAMALHARMRVPEMLHLDLSYAPPFAPVWDPLLIAANEAQKKISRS